MDKSLIESYIKDILNSKVNEALTPDQASKVKDKYKQIYSGMLKGDKKKLLKYIDPKFNRPNPDAMATGRAINLVKKDEDGNVEESKTEKQRRWACAQVDSKSRPKGLSKAQAKEMCSDTDLSKNENMENTRLHELIKTALKEPVKEGYYGTSDIENITNSLGYSDLNEFFNDNPGAKDALISFIENVPEFRKSLENDFSNQELEELGFYDLEGYDSDSNIEESFPDLTGDGKVTKADILKGRGVKLEEGTDLVDKHGYQFTRFSMGEEGPGLQITGDYKSYITIPGSKLGVFASALTDAIRAFDDMSRQLPVDEDVVKGSNIKKVGDDWRILSGKTGKMWKQKYDSKKDAEAGLKGYFASQNESLAEIILKELRK